MPRWDGASRHRLRLHPHQNAHPEAEGDPGQRREDPSGPPAASARPQAQEASRHHQGAQPAPGEPAAAGAGAAAAEEESSGLWSLESLRGERRQEDAGLKRGLREELDPNELEKLNR